MRNPARERSRNLNREVWESPSVYGGEDVNAGTLTYFLVFTSGVNRDKIKIMTQVSQALQSDANGNNPKKLLVNNDNWTISLDLYGQLLPEITKIK